MFVSQLVKPMIHCRHVQSHLRLGIFLLPSASRSREMHQYLLHHLSNVTEIRTRIGNLNDHKIVMSRKLQSATLFAVQLKLYADPLLVRGHSYISKRKLTHVSREIKIYDKQQTWIFTTRLKFPPFFLFTLYCFYTKISLLLVLCQF